MPVKDCKINGQSGKQWGDSGKCYTGPKAEEKAAAQGRAIKATQTKQTKDK